MKMEKAEDGGIGRRGPLVSGRAGLPARPARTKPCARYLDGAYITEGTRLMAEVFNWQLGRTMTYPLRGGAAREAGGRGLRHQQVHRVPDLHPGLQDLLDLGPGPGVHAVEQRRDQAVGLVPPGLRRPGARQARTSDLGRRRLHGQDDLRGGPRRARSTWAGPRATSTTPTPTGARTRSTSRSPAERYHLKLPHDMWFFYLPRVCNHCTYPACLQGCPRTSIYKRPEDGIVLRRPGALPGLPGVLRRLPLQEDLLQPRHPGLGEVRVLLPGGRDRASSPAACATASARSARSAS